MKKREEIEMTVYEKLGIRKLIRISNELDQFIKVIRVALTPKSKREAKKEKLKNYGRFFPEERVEGLLRFQRKAGPNARYGFYVAVVSLIGVYAAVNFGVIMNAIIYSTCAAMGFSSAVINRYGKLKAKKIEEKWYHKYENQKEDVINDIMGTNKELGYPRVEIVDKNNKAKQTSLRELTSDAELSRLQAYRDYLKSYAEAYQKGETLPVMNYSKKKGTVLRLVPSYAKTRK